MQSSSSFNFYCAPASEYPDIPYLDQLECAEISDFAGQKNTYRCKIKLVNHELSVSAVNQVCISYLLNAVDPEKLINNSSIPSYNRPTCTPADKKMANDIIRDLITNI